ncbi:general secretion pathway protein J [Ectothiorhodospira magna]|uniref:General secretion pathway protein J n=2 Tax=Ectothiorhodospira magna TaxID=867345 RepID=A0A1H9BJA5_9GAMM|nr:general secretion pathway protein J [Ectothiorhodospira magna]
MPIAGFTLVEVLVALTLTSLLLLSLITGLRGISDAATRTDALAQRVTEMRLVSDFLRHHVAGALSVTYADPDQDATPPRHYFQGDARRLQWVGELQAVHAPGGLFVFRLQALPDQGILQLGYMPYPGRQWHGDWAGEQRHVLIQGLDHWAVRYQDARGQWHDQWQDSSGLPTLVSIMIQAEGRHWPELLIALGGP